MNSLNPASTLSPDEIRQFYYPRNIPPAPSLESTTARPFSIQTNSAALTPTAQFVARQARHRLGHKSLLSHDRAPNDDELLALVAAVEEAEGEDLSEHERTAVIATLHSSFENFDVLTSLVENPSVNDIIVRSYDDVSVQTNRLNYQTDIQFPDHQTYQSFVENLLKRSGKACTLATPVIDVAVSPDIRACVTHESFSPAGSGPMLTLRVARHHDVTREELTKLGLAPSIILDYLATLVRHGRSTLLIAGEVGTGKTTLVKALAAAIPENEAILVVEDTHELVLHRRFVRTLLTREANSEGAGQITPAMAIRTGMRMAMNRIILGEMRDAQAAETFIDVCSSGHSGISTIHARSGRDAIARLELFLARAQGQVGIDTIRKEISQAVSVIAFIDVDKVSGKRRICEVLEIASSADGNVQLSPIFSFTQQRKEMGWKRDSGISRYHDVLRDQNVILPPVGTIISVTKPDEDSPIDFRSA